MGINSRTRNTNNLGVNIGNGKVKNVKPAVRALLGLNLKESEDYRRLMNESEEHGFKGMSSADTSELDRLQVIVLAARDMAKFDKLPGQFTEKEIREYADLLRQVRDIRSGASGTYRDSEYTDQEKKTYAALQKFEDRKKQLHRDSLSPVDWSDEEQLALEELKKALSDPFSAPEEYVYLAEKELAHLEYRRTMNPKKDLNDIANLSDENRKLKQLLDSSVKVDGLSGLAVEYGAYWFADASAKSMLKAYDEGILGGDKRSNEIMDATMEFLRKHPDSKLDGRVRCTGPKPVLWLTTLSTTKKNSAKVNQEIRKLLNKFNTIQ